MQNKIQCAIYTRVSTDNQAEVEFNSCKAQEEKIKSFIKSQDNMEIFNIYSDAGFTGANIERPAMQQMLSDIQQGKINLVISYKIDRLTRSPKDFYQLIELFEKYNVDFISVTERFDTSTPAGRLLRNIMLTFAQFERELTSERTKDKMLQRAQKGMWNGGNVPFGYLAEDKKLRVAEQDAEKVKEIFNSYITDQSTANIYQKLKDQNIYLSKSRISSILRNPIYTGKLRYSGQNHKGNHEAIISNEIFDLTQELHKKKLRNLRLYKNYPLARLVKCEECGSYMTPCHTNKKSRGKIRRYYYYRCTSTFKKEWKNCSTKQVSANRLEDFIFDNLQRISLDKQYIDSLIFKLNHGAPDGRSGLELTLDSSQISAEIFAHTLQALVSGLRSRQGIRLRQKKASPRSSTDINIFLKKYIKNIKYSPS
ncbi:MAG: recombinase family protein, partial [Candidatus Omnitrophota bacterium]